MGSLWRCPQRFIAPQAEAPSASQEEIWELEAVCAGSRGTSSLCNPPARGCTDGEVQAGLPPSPQNYLHEAAEGLDGAGAGGCSHGKHPGGVRSLMGV